MTLDNFISNLVIVIVNPLINLLFAAALAYFIWGVVVYIRKADSPTDRETGANHIMWGIIGLLIMVSVYSILRIALSTVFL